MKPRLAPHCLALALAILACGCTPKVTVESLVTEARENLASGNLEKAKESFLQANERDVENLDSLLGLGQIYRLRGQLRQAYRAFKRYDELSPNSPDVSLYLAETYLYAGKHNKARVAAIKSLQTDPSLHATLLVFARASKAPTQAYKSLQFLESSIDSEHPFPELLTSKAILCTHLARYQEAEAYLSQSLQIAPGNFETLLASAQLSWARGELEQAERYFQEAVTQAPPYTDAGLQAADFHKAQDNEVAALRILEIEAKRQNDHIPTLRELAKYYEASGQWDNAIRQSTKILEIEPSNPESMLLDGMLKIAAGRSAEALEPLEKLVAEYPNSSKAQIQLGIAYLNTNAPKKALEHLNKARYAAPDSTEANLLLAGAEASEANFSSAVYNLRDYLNRRPDDPEVKRYLGQILQAKGDYQEALDVFIEIASSENRTPETHLSIAICYLHLRKPEYAYEILKNCVEVYPDFFPAIEQLTLIDAARTRFDLARERLDQYAAAHGRTSNFTLVKGALAMAEGKFDEAESLLRETIQTDPTENRAYLILSNALIEEGRIDEAIKNLSTAVESKAASKQTLMILGSLFEQTQEPIKAAACYEKILSDFPRFHPALNNLAYIYSSKLGDLDRALELAERARDLSPSNPDVADTLGWILAKQGKYSWASSLLAEAASKLPNNAEVHYHLGFCRYMLGLEESAAQSLGRALELADSFPGRTDCLTRIGVLSTDPKNTSPRQTEFLDAQIQADPHDIIAILKRADIHQQSGNLAQAKSLVKAALAIAPNSPPAIVRLAEISEAEGYPKQALALAKQAYSIDPNYKANLPLLARLAYTTGSPDWSASLYQSILNSNPNSEYSYELAKSYLSSGKLDLASQALSKAKGSAKSRQLAILLQYARSPLSAKPLELEDSDPLLKLLQQALTLQANQQNAEAIATYQTLLQKFPKASFAESSIARLALRSALHDKSLFETSQRAYYRTSTDPELAIAYAQQAYHQGEYEAVERSLASLSEAPIAKLYRGLSASKMGDAPKAKQLLESALAGGLETTDQIVAEKEIAQLERNL
ncbi:tetratricopeptide repeat protein [Pelagicoccus enzymogenes]|uniref:tetratricopeptide repeat protein n=1 Tax=Pelagicoccus enzymogenes TaxID=2773457 RepID=UPI00280FDBA4|nr:tetratricopeptide repeat protein [Pelagicoccus enzymogenes]MDQ8197023.1 tetratricopeptide repeat protein [Pelagicoccus enzymogenes]